MKKFSIRNRKKGRKSNWSKERIKASFGTMTFRHGTFSIAAVALVIAIAVLINLIAGQLPSGVKEIDISDNKIYEISDTSRKLLKNLEQEIQITVIAEEDSIDERLRTFLDKYTALSDKITMEIIDPVLHPSVLTEYDTETDTIVVECEETGLSQTVAFSDILVQSASYYYTGTDSISSFDGDGQLTGAISQVIGQETKKIYYTTGHGESELSSSITNLMQKSGLETEELNLLMSGEIPEDCDSLLINGPTSDISETEKNLLDQYIKQGGNVIVLMAEEGPETGNLRQLLKSYQITMKKGYVADMERSYQGNYYAIFPSVTASAEELTEGLDSGMVLLSNSRGFELGESSDEITVSSILETSSNSYAVTEDGEEEGTYAIGAVASYTAEAENSDSDSEGESSEDSGDTVTGTLTVYGSNTLIDENITEVFSGLDNKTLFMNSILSAFDDMDNLSIEAKSMEVQYNTVQYGGYLSVLLIFVIPIGILIFGFIFWMRRRKS